MTQANDFELIRLRAVASAQSQDAELWRWFSDQMEERCIECRRGDGIWSIKVSGQELGRDSSFDAAMRAAYGAISGRCR